MFEIKMKGFLLLLLIFVIFAVYKKYKVDGFN